jgi:hypothetical protein
MIATIKNLWTLTKSFPNIVSFFVMVGKIAPAIIALVKEIAAVFGSDETKKLIESIKETVKQESPRNIPDIPQTEGQRRRILDRVRQRLGLSWLGLSEQEYGQICALKGMPTNIEEV